MRIMAMSLRTIMRVPKRSPLAGLTAAIGVVAVVGIHARPLSAQQRGDRPIDLGSATEQGLQDLSSEGDRPLQITGFGVADYDYAQRTGDNSAQAGKLAVALFRELSDNVWIFGQLTTALATEEAEDLGPGEEVPTEIEIDNLLVNFTPGGSSGLSLSVGKFDLPLGFERDDEPLNLQATGSYNFELARPVKLVGAVGRWAVNPKLDLSAMAGNGWDSQVDENHGKTVGLRVGVLPTEGSSFGIGGLFGPEGEQGETHDRWLLTGDYALEPGRGWIVAGEANYGGEKDFVAEGEDASWYGATLTLFRRMSDNFGTALRGEVFRDPDGARTGDPQTLQSLTLAPVYFIGTGREGIFANVEHTTFRIPRFQIRAEARLDHSSIDAFETSDGESDWQMNYVLQLVATF
jgi:hypothetical protein